MARRRVREAQRPTTPRQHRGEIDGAQQPSDVASTGSPKRGFTPVESVVRHVAHLLPARTCPQLGARQCARVGRSGCPRLRGGSGSQPPSPAHNHRVLASVAAWRFVALVVVAVLAAVIQARLVQRQCLHSPPHASTFHAPMAVEGAPSEVVGVPQESVEETPSWKTEHPIIFDVLHSATDGLNAWIHEYNDVTGTCPSSWRRCSLARADTLGAVLCVARLVACCPCGVLRHYVHPLLGCRYTGQPDCASADHDVRPAPPSVCVSGCVCKSLACQGRATVTHPVRVL